MRHFSPDFFLWVAINTSSLNSSAQVASVVAQKLIQAYPQHLKAVDGNYIVWKDGTRMRWDDGKTKTFERQLNDPDLEDQLAQPYPAGETYDLPAENYDPGRIRYEPFFQKMYGATKSEVESNLVEISWLPKTANVKLKVTKINNVAEKLQAISNELDSRKHLHKYLIRPGGTFSWRKIAATTRMSNHSYAIAIDINVSQSNYWQWEVKDSTAKIAYRNRIPMEIVAVFEKYGFIWGGKWYHYDTMHFEYRPELF